MLYARLYRKDLISGEVTQMVDWVCVRNDLTLAHHDATMACKRKGAIGYKLFQGDSVKHGKAVSLMHEVVD